MNQCPDTTEYIDDPDRLKVLYAADLMDSQPYEAFDRLTNLTSRVLKTPIALVSLVDKRRQFFKSCCGLPEPWATKRETPLSHSFCKYVVETASPLIINDARKHEVLKYNGAVRDLGVVAYAGIPIKTSKGFVLGSFCVIDTVERFWSQDEIQILTELTASVVTEIELGIAVRESRLRAEESANSSARMHAILLSSLDCIISIDEEGIILEFNPAAESTFGYKSDDVIGRRMVDLIVPPRLRTAHVEGVKRYLASNDPHVIGKRINITAVRSNGVEFPVELAITEIDFPKKIFTAYIRDITEQRSSDEAIDRSRTMLAAIQRAQGEFISEAHDSELFSGLLDRLLSMTRSEYGFIGEVLHSTDDSPYLKTHAITNISWDPDTRAFYDAHKSSGLEFFNLDALFRSVLVTGERVIENIPAVDTKRGRQPNGHPKMDCFLGMPFFHGNEMVGMVGIANRQGGYDDDLCDYLSPFLATCGSLISAQRVRRQRSQFEETLRIERDFKSAVFETVGALVIVLDRNGIVVEFNNTCEQIMGYSRDAVLGRPLYEAPFYPEADREYSHDFWSSIPEDWIPSSHERWWQSKSGTRRLISWSNTVLRDTEGRITHVVRCGMDITEQRANEIELLKARQNELEIGSKIQQTLLVTRPPERICGFKTGTIARASQGIDGDYIEFFNCGQHFEHFDFLIGDVMGKGATAALLGAASKGQFQRAIRRLITLMAEFGRPPKPEEILAAVQHVMAPELIRLESFITLCYARFDPRSRTLTMIDCGHTRTIHYHASTGDCSLLQGENLPLGVLTQELYTPLVVNFEPGDVLMFYSDGVTEAQNENREFYGEQRLLDAVKAGAGESPQELVEHILMEVGKFTSRQNFTDDFTCVAFRFEDAPLPLPLKRIAQEFNGSMDQLEAMREFVRSFCQDSVSPPLNEDATHLMVLGINEAVTNIIRHAYGGREDQTVQIIAEYEADVVVFYLHDGGINFDPTAVPEPNFDGDRDGGFGMFIISQCFDEIYYDHYDLGRNCLSLSHTIKPDDREGYQRKAISYDI